MLISIQPISFSKISDIVKNNLLWHSLTSSSSCILLPFSTTSENHKHVNVSGSWVVNPMHGLLHVLAWLETSSDQSEACFVIHMSCFSFIWDACLVILIVSSCLQFILIYIMLFRNTNNSRMHTVMTVVSDVCEVFTWIHVCINSLLNDILWSSRKCFLLNKLSSINNVYFSFEVLAALLHMHAVFILIHVWLLWLHPTHISTVIPWKQNWRC